jgi:AraC-like DNA-binding protein
MVPMNNLFKPYQPSQMRQNNYQEIIPQGNCSNSIALFYQFHPSDNSSSQPLLIVPDSCVDIVFILESRHPCVKAWGSVLRGKELYLAPGCDYFGIRFLPGKSSLFLKNPHHFVDEEIIVTEIVQQQGLYLDKLAAASSFADRVQIIINDWGVKAAQEQDASHNLAQYVLKDIVEHHGNIRIEDMSLQSGYSIRHVDRIFRLHVGISPKQFSRIVRFQHIINKLVTPSSLVICDLVGEYGYFDQAHFIHEFKEFSSLTPSQFMQTKSANNLRRAGPVDGQ